MLLPYLVKHFLASGSLHKLTLWPGNLLPKLLLDFVVLSLFLCISPHSPIKTETSFLPFLTRVSVPLTIYSSSCHLSPNSIQGIYLFGLFLIVYLPPVEYKFHEGKLFIYKTCHILNS
jgi:hypothetical protein